MSKWSKLRDPGGRTYRVQEIKLGVPIGQQEVKFSLPTDAQVSKTWDAQRFPGDF